MTLACMQEVLGHRVPMVAIVLIFLGQSLIVRALRFVILWWETIIRVMDGIITLDVIVLPMDMEIMDISIIALERVVGRMGAGRVVRGRCVCQCGSRE